MAREDLAILKHWGNKQRSQQNPEWEDVPPAIKCHKHSMASQTPLRSADEKWNCSAFLKNVMFPSNTISKETGNLRFFPMPIPPIQILSTLFSTITKISKQTYLNFPDFKELLSRILSLIFKIHQKQKLQFSWVLYCNSLKHRLTEVHTMSKCSQRIRSVQV